MPFHEGRVFEVADTRLSQARASASSESWFIQSAPEGHLHMVGSPPLGF